MRISLEKDDFSIAPELLHSRGEDNVWFGHLFSYWFSNARNPQTDYFHASKGFQITLLLEGLTDSLKIVSNERCDFWHNHWLLLKLPQISAKYSNILMFGLKNNDSKFPYQ